MDQVGSWLRDPREFQPNLYMNDGVLYNDDAVDLVQGKRPPGLVSGRESLSEVARKEVLRRL